MTSTDDPYILLGISRNSDQKTIKGAYHKLALKHHPDKCPDDETAAERFRAITTAYRSLLGRSAPSKRSSDLGIETLSFTLDQLADSIKTSNIVALERMLEAEGITPEVGKGRNLFYGVTPDFLERARSALQEERPLAGIIYEEGPHWYPLQEVEQMLGMESRAGVTARIKQYTKRSGVEIPRKKGVVKITDRMGFTRTYTAWFYHLRPEVVVELQKRK